MMAVYARQIEIPCPYCASPGIKILLLPTKNRIKVMTDCPCGKTANAILKKAYGEQP